MSDWIWNKLRKFKNYIRHIIRSSKLNTIYSNRSLKIIIGSSGTQQYGWVSTDMEEINLLDEKTWNRYFKLNSIDAILAEHVWEHLSSEEAGIAAKNCFNYLRPGGYLRLAVPDGLHTDPVYIQSVEPNGTGAGASDHKILYTYKTLKDLFFKKGFKVLLLEYFDEEGQFHYNKWDPAHGLIRRSMRFDERNIAKPLSYTSIVMDAIKPLKQ